MSARSASAPRRRGPGTAGRRAGCRAGGSRDRRLGGDDVEGVHEVALVVRGAHAVADVDEQPAVADAGEVEVDRQELDARLPAVERLTDLGLEAPDGRCVDRLEDE